MLMRDKGCMVLPSWSFRQSIETLENCQLMSLTEKLIGLGEGELD